MAYRIEFQDSNIESGTADIHRTDCDGKNYIAITLYDDGDILTSLWLDKSTAIKFAKTLRTEINKIVE